MFCISEPSTGADNNVSIYKKYGIFFFELGQKVSNIRVIPSNKCSQVTLSKLDKAWHACGCMKSDKISHSSIVWLPNKKFFLIYMCMYV